MKPFYMERIKEATTISELDYIVEQASNSVSNNSDYVEIYTAAMNKAREMGGMK